MTPLFTVAKVQIGRNKFLVEGALYNLKAHKLETWGTLHTGRDAAQLVADRMTSAIIDQAEFEGARFDAARAYLASRAARVAIPSPQLALF